MGAGEGMGVFAETEASTAGDLLAYLCAAAARGEAAAARGDGVARVLAAAGCRAAGDGCFHFPALRGSAAVCGWGQRVWAVAALALLAPLLAGVALVVLLCDGRPVFFCQRRYGAGERMFTMYKFRTMVRDAEWLHAQLEADGRPRGGLFKMRGDPRVTRPGAFLRRWFLDELPQLVNVVKGEMRFFGPRPLPASDQRCYTHAYHALRLSGVPGMTGLWQVSGRNAHTFDEMCLLDYYYLCNRSARFDLWLAWRTVGAVLKEERLERDAEQGGGQHVQVQGEGRE